MIVILVISWLSWTGWTALDQLNKVILKVIYHPLYSMNIVVTNKSKLPQDGVQVFPYNIRKHIMG